MTKQEIGSVIESIRPADGPAMEKAQQRQDQLAKPPGSLGGLEEIAVRMAGITGEVIADAPQRGCVLVFCADNGVTAQGVASAPQSVTRAQTINFTRRLTGVGVLSKSFGSELLIVDMGVKEPIPGELYDDVPLRDTERIIDRRIRPGTWDISQGPAMSEEEALQALAAGMEMARAAIEEGYDILGIGEMGIGNTTTSAAVLSALTGRTAEETCGRGGGVNDKGFARKKEIVEQVRRECSEAAADSEAAESGAGSEDRIDRVVRILARAGGFDLCAMTGAYLGAAAGRTPAVIDGYISAVAALAAAEISPDAKDYLFASHRSAEPGYNIAIDKLGLNPFLSLDMRLGEGSGCPIAFDIIRGACDVMRNMATFEEAEINDDYLEEVRQGGCL
ncbi:MAG: nicotinate-nucleotide--dimethylbenzimidazole phosphoribosyltransferase [Firmicutes bacterium]|nr:nicotinate-nucleotide--dimethylbenzimidazole phosphoribosyltransferase [Bacillota bacterium]